MDEEPKTPGKTANKTFDSSPSSAIASVGTADSSSSPSSRKRKNEEIYKSSPSKSKIFSSRPSTATEDARTKLLAGSLDFASMRQLSSGVVTPFQSDGSRQESAAIRANMGSSHREISFVDQIEEYKSNLEEEYRAFENNLHSVDQDEIQAMDWDDLETRYDEAIEPLEKEEHDMLNDFEMQFKHFLLWIQVSNNREAERAIKRLRTRAAFVKNSEVRLADKQAHHKKVLEAFQSAMALLYDS